MSSVVPWTDQKGLLCFLITCISEMAKEERAMAARAYGDKVEDNMAIGKQTQTNNLEIEMFLFI